MKTRKSEKMELGSSRMSPFVLRIENRIFGQWAQISTPNSFASASNRQFGHTVIDSALNFVFTPVEEGFPGGPTAFRASEDGKILWGKVGYRGLWAIDRDTKGKLSDVTVSIDGSSEISDGWSIGKDQSWLMVQCFLPPGPDPEVTSDQLICYDLTTHRKLFQKDDIGNRYGPNSQAYLFLLPTVDGGEFYASKEYAGKGYEKRAWELVKIDEQGLSKPWDNNLTKTMTEKNFGLTLWPQEIKRWDIKTRYMFGNVMLPGLNPEKFDPSTTPSVVRWDEKMEDVTVSPLTNHIPKGYRTFGAWAVSPDGKWARCGVHYGEDYDREYICFFHLDEKYPLGVSPGIVGAYSYLRGIFVEHEELGTLYLDWPDDNWKIPEHDPMRKAAKAGAVLLYKMSDFFPALTAQQKGY